MFIHDRLALQLSKCLQEHAGDDDTNRSYSISYIADAYY